MAFRRDWLKRAMPESVREVPPARFWAIQMPEASALFILRHPHFAALLGVVTIKAFAMIDEQLLIHAPVGFPARFAVTYRVAIRAFIVRGILCEFVRELSGFERRLSERVQIARAIDVGFANAFFAPRDHFVHQVLGRRV